MLDHVTELLASLPEGGDENQEEENGDLEEEELDSISSGDEEMDTQWQWMFERHFKSCEKWDARSDDLLKRYPLWFCRRWNTATFCHDYFPLVASRWLYFLLSTVLEWCYSPRRATYCQRFFPPFFCILMCSPLFLGIIGGMVHGTIFSRPNSHVPRFAPNCRILFFKTIIRHILHLTVFTAILYRVSSRYSWILAWQRGPLWRLTS